MSAGCFFNSNNVFFLDQAPQTKTFRYSLPCFSYKDLEYKGISNISFSNQNGCDPICIYIDIYNPNPYNIKLQKGLGELSIKENVIGDLSSRRAQVSGSEARGNTTTVSAMVPLANMFGYINTLRSMTQGRAQYSMFFDHYEQVPQNVQDEVKAKFA